MQGFLLVDKAGGMTSHDVVAKMRKKFGTKRVGHAGTLDPMATGVLVLGVGSATRLLQYITDGTKAYEAIISLGSSTHTDDKEGEVLTTASGEALSALSEHGIKNALQAFIGTIKQRPSSVSAIKIEGKPAHQRIRDGEVVDIPEREVTITDISVHQIRHLSGSIEVDISVTCSAGTYIRAIARDLGESLHVGGHLVALRRTLVSPFTLDECAPIADVNLIPTVEGISRLFPLRDLDFVEVQEVSFGRYLSPNPNSGIFVAVTPQGEFAGLLQNKDVSGQMMAAPSLVAVKE